MNTKPSVNGVCVCNDNYTKGVGGCYSVSQSINPISKYIAYLPHVNITTNLELCRLHY